MERELWKQLYILVMRLDKGWSNAIYRDSDVLVVYLWAVVHDRPTSWACNLRNWDDQLPRLPSQPTMSRRLRRPGVQQLLSAVEAELAGDPRRWWVQRIDGKPLPVGTHTKDRSAKLGPAGHGFAKGYKLHAIWGDGPLPSVWQVQPMNAGEATVARQLVNRLSGEGYIVGDCQYDSNPLHEVARCRGYQLIAPPQREGKALGHRRHSRNRLRSLELLSKPFGQALFHDRDQIERDYGGLTSFASGLAPLPSWVRRPHRVHLWVEAKLLINALRLLNKVLGAMTAPA